MLVDISLTINGRAHTLSVAATDMLVDVLREKLHLTGTNKDCCMGICGACTVLVDGRTASSCILLAVQADGRDIVTVEGLERDGKLNPVQEAFLRHGAVQCGYCTPGLVITATALLRDNPRPRRDERACRPHAHRDRRTRRERPRAGRSGARGCQRSL